MQTYCHGHKTGRPLPRSQKGDSRNRPVRVQSVLKALAAWLLASSVPRASPGCHPAEGLDKSITLTGWLLRAVMQIMPPSCSRRAQPGIPLWLGALTLVRKAQDSSSPAP